MNGRLQNSWSGDSPEISYLDVQGRRGYELIAKGIARSRQCVAWSAWVSPLGLGSIMRHFDLLQPTGQPSRTATFGLQNGVGRWRLSIALRPRAIRRDSKTHSLTRTGNKLRCELRYDKKVKEERYSYNKYGQFSFIRPNVIYQRGVRP
jgi:hypothetical protein